MIVPAVLVCPHCAALHLDEGEWATRPHHVHLCANCGRTWDIPVEQNVYFAGIPLPLG